MTIPTEWYPWIGWAWICFNIAPLLVAPSYQPKHARGIPLRLPRLIVGVRGLATMLTVAFLVTGTLALTVLPRWYRDAALEVFFVSFAIAFLRQKSPLRSMGLPVLAIGLSQSASVLPPLVPNAKGAIETASTVLIVASIIAAVLWMLVQPNRALDARNDR